MSKASRRRRRSRGPIAFTGLTAEHLAEMAKGKVVVIPPTEEYRKWYEWRQSTRDNGAAWAREQQMRGLMSKEEADQMVRTARIFRKLRKAKAKMK